MPASVLVKFGSVDITDEAVSWTESCPRRLNPITTPREDGAKISEEPTFEPRTVRIALEVHGSSADDARTNFDAIVQSFPLGRSTLYKHDDRYLNAYWAGIDSEEFVEGSAGLVFRATITFFCDDPFYYSTSASSSSDAGLVATNTFTINNTGGSRVWPTWTFTPAGGTMTSFTIRNNTLSPQRTFDYQGSVSAGNALVADAEDKTVANNGTSDLNNWKTSGGTGSDFLWLEPGVNTLEIVTLTGPTSITVASAYTKRWI